MIQCSPSNADPDKHPSLLSMKRTSPHLNRNPVLKKPRRFFLSDINSMSIDTPTQSETKFYSSKQLVELYSASRSIEIFFRADAIKKAANDSTFRACSSAARAYVQPIAIKTDGERHDDVDWRFNLNNSTVDVIKRNSSREFWIISIDASTVKQFIDREGISHDFHPSETMFVMNAKTIAKLKDVERARQPVVGYEGEF